MKKKLPLSILAIAVVILIAGCTSNVAVNQNAGIGINLFSSTPTQVLSGDTVLFETEIQNIGGTTARNTEVELFGVQGTWRDRDGQILDTTLPQSFGILQPPIPERSLPGGTRMNQWELMTPVVPQGVTVSVPVEIRVFYDYNTSGYMQISAISEDEFQRQRIQGISPVLPIVVNSAGPLQLNIPTADQYQYIVIATTSGQDEFIYPFRIVFMNAGSGFPVTDERDGRDHIGGGGRITGTINLYGPGVEFADCLGADSGTEIDLDSTDIVPRIREDQTADIACNIKFDLNEWGERPTDTVTLVFNIFYTYYESARTEVSVIGR